jgi:hypothetical protein
VSPDNPETLRQQFERFRAVVGIGTSEGLDEAGFADFEAQLSRRFARRTHHPVLQRRPRSSAERRRGAGATGRRQRRRSRQPDANIVVLQQPYHRSFV